MKKRLMSLIVLMIMFMTFVPQISVHAGAISADEMRTKFAELRAQYPTGTYWNGTYMGASQCIGFAFLVDDYLFGECARDWYVHGNIDNLCVGDHIRYRANYWDHSMVVTNISGETVYFVDCNGYGGSNKVYWGQTTKSQIAEWIGRYPLYDGNTRRGGYGYIQTQSDNWIKTLDNPQPQPQPDPVHVDTNSHVRNGFFTFKNVSSGKYMNVYGGVDTNTTEVTMWEYDDSIDQQFNVVHQGGGKYKLYAVCSSSGTNRVVDVYRGNDAPAEGDVVDLWTPDDDTSQLFYVWPVGDNEYVFELASMDGYVIAPAGDGAAGTDGSQLTLQKYNGSGYQKWKLCNNNGKETAANVSYAPGAYKVDTNGVVLRMRSGAGTSNSQVGTVPDGAILSISQVNGNWGYTNYNGTNGWVCLDFTVYTIILDSITISKNPDQTDYYAGDKLNTQGMEITARYSNGETETLSTGFEISCDLSNAGTKDAIVSYKGKTATFSVNVQNKSISEIVVYSLNTKTQYYVNETIKNNDLNLLVYYDNGSSDVISDGYTTTYDFSSSGTKTVTVNYGGQITTYDVEVREKPADDKAVISIPSVNCNSGASVDVYVNLKGSDIYDGNMTIQYDSSKLSVKDTEVCGALLNSQVTVNEKYADNQIRMSFAGTTPVISEGSILKIEFAVLEDAGGSAEISVISTRMYNKSGETISTDISNGNINITTVVNSVEVTNIQSTVSGERKTVTANISNDNVMCYLAAYKDGILVECDVRKPVDGSVDLSVGDNSDAQFKFMVWNTAMKPLIEARNIY